MFRVDGGMSVDGVGEGDHHVDDGHDGLDGLGDA